MDKPKSKRGGARPGAGRKPSRAAKDQGAIGNQTIENNQSKSNIGVVRGGARKGSGRKPGSLTKRTREIAERAAAEGITPLEYMLTVMRTDATHEDAKVQVAREAMKFQAAVAAAPYIHPRLQAIEHSGSVDWVAKVSDAELDAEIKERSERLGVPTPPPAITIQ